MPRPLPPVAEYTDRGRRPSNQDAVLVRLWPDGRALLAVADGMGGHSAGEVAAQRALEVLAAGIESGVSLREAIRTANAAVLAEGRSVPHLEGMGTTLVALLLQDGQYQVANVGDSRAYRIDAAKIEQITRDHSFVAEAVRSGELSAEEALRSPWRNALTRSIGADVDVQVDVFGPFPADERHIVLLCTDGLYRALPDSRIRTVVLDAPDLEAGVRTLGRLAYEEGSDDNITIAAIHFGVPAAGRQMEGTPGEPAAVADGMQALHRRASSGQTAPARPAGATAPSDPRGMPWAGPEAPVPEETGTFMFRVAREEPRWDSTQRLVIVLLLALVLGYIALLALALL